MLSRSGSRSQIATIEVPSNVSGTVKAVKQFQSRNGLNATGVVDEATSLALGLSSNPLYGLKQGATGDGVRQLQQPQLAGRLVRGFDAFA